MYQELKDIYQENTPKILSLMTLRDLMYFSLGLWLLFKALDLPFILSGPFLVLILIPLQWFMNKKYLVNKKVTEAKLKYYRLIELPLGIFVGACVVLLLASLFGWL